MAKAGQNFEMFSGETKNIVITVTDSNTGVVVDLTGATVKWSLKKTFNAPDDVYKDSSTGGIIITEAVNGKFSVNLASDDTKLLAGSYVHIAKIIDAIGNTSIVTVGTVTIDQ